MVNLPSSSVEARAAGEPANTHPSRRARSHHSWGARLGRRREEYREEPATLGQLEERAERSVELMEKYGAVSDRNFDVAMDLLRQQYNMNFVVVCEKCKGSHLYDEIMAPERSIKVY